MSGGRWGYFQSRFEWEEITDDLLEQVISNPRQYSQKTLAAFIDAIWAIEKAQAYITVIDYLLEGDYNENTFHEELNKQLKTK